MLQKYDSFVTSEKNHGVRNVKTISKREMN